MQWIVGGIVDFEKIEPLSYPITVGLNPFFKGRSVLVSGSIFVFPEMRPPSLVSRLIAVTGSQLAVTLADCQYDGILGLWYGKGPGIDRAGDGEVMAGDLRAIDQSAFAAD